MSRSRKRKGSGQSSDPGAGQPAESGENSDSNSPEASEELVWDKDFLGDEEESVGADASGGAGERGAQEEDEFLGAPMDDPQQEAGDSFQRRERPPELRAAPADSRPLQPRPLSQAGVGFPPPPESGESAEESAESPHVAEEEETGQPAARVPRPLGAAGGRYTAPVSARVRAVTSSHTGRHLVAGQTASVGGGTGWVQGGAGGAYQGPVAQPSKAPAFLVGLGCGIVLALLLVAVTPLSGVLGLQAKREAENQALKVLELEQRHVNAMLSDILPDQFIDMAKELRYWREENGEPDPVDQVFRGMRYRPANSDD